MVFKRYILLVWQFPQVILGYFIIRVSEAEYFNDKGFITIYTTKKRFGISLGPVIIVSEKFNKNKRTMNHQYGHSIQSEILGPLYLLVVGLPSMIMNVLTRLKVLEVKNYYKRWPESWADKLGGIK